MLSVRKSKGAMLIAALLFFLFIATFKVQYKQRLYSPEKKYYFVAKTYVLANFRLFAMPGDGGGGYDSGVIELYTSDGKSLGSRYVEAMHLLDTISWKQNSVTLKFVGEWKLPNPICEHVSTGFNAKHIHKLELTFKDSSQISIREENGCHLAYRFHHKGDVVRVSSSSKINVFISEANAVTVGLNGAPFDISEYIKGTYAEFSIED